jgi:hypothetical protein
MSTGMSGGRKDMSESTQVCPDRLTQDAMTPQDTWMDASPLSVQYEDVPMHTAMQPTIPDSSQSLASHTSWQQSLDIDLIEIGPAFDESAQHAFRSSTIEELSGAASHVAPKASDQTTTSDSSQSLSAERLRKYF